MTTINATNVQAPEVPASRMLATMLFFVFCCSGAFAQQCKVVEPAVVIEYHVAATNTQMELVYWVMGSRQGRAIHVETTISQHKQLINSGMAPNRILSQSFLNKAINYENTIS